MIRNQFRDDDRAIEGLPIRLVIALVVGVAALALMMNMLSGFGGISKTEVHWETTSSGDRVVGTSGGTSVTMQIRDEKGNSVTSGKVLIKEGSAELTGPDGPIVKDISSSGEVTVNFGSKSPDLRSGQTQGTLKVTIVPPRDGKYQDEQQNAEIMVVEGSP